ncbi:MAG: hypothetical protein ABIB97_06250 [Patescibacteria group bacterium]
MCGIVGAVQGKSRSVNPFLVIGRSFRDLDHRGQHGAGAAVVGDEFAMQKNLGKATIVFDPERPEYKTLAKISNPKMAVGQARYSTQGENNKKNLQPHVLDTLCGPVCCLSNGDLPECCPLRQRLEGQGIDFRSENDAEYLLRRAVQLSDGRPSRLITSIKQLMLELRGAYSAIIMTKDVMIVFRDPWGIRPLVQGALGDAPIFASETCTIKGLGANVIGTVKPGEMVVVTPAGVQDRIQVVRAARCSHCIFELIYMSRPDSFFEGVEAGAFRYRCGRRLAQEHPRPEDEFVSSVPRSGDMSAIGYAAESGHSFRITLIHKPSVGRQFIEESESDDPRDKYSAMEGAFRHRKSGLWLDDSIMTGRTWAKLAELIREAGCQTIDLLVASPPNRYACNYGIHTKKAEMLWINRFIGGDGRLDLVGGAKDLTINSLGYLSHEGLLSAFEDPHSGESESDPEQWCTHCLDARPVFSEIEPVTN